MEKFLLKVLIELIEIFLKTRIQEKKAPWVEKKFSVTIQNNMLKNPSTKSTTIQVSLKRNDR